MPDIYVQKRINAVGTHTSSVGHYPIKVRMLTYQEQPSGDYLNGMLDTVLLLTQRVRPGKSPEFDQAAHDLLALVMDMKSFDLMERLGPAWESCSPPKVGTVHASR
jgi:hypothetical protein